MAALVLFAQFGLRFLLRYQLREEKLVLSLLGFIPLGVIPLARIRDIREVSLAEVAPLAWAPRWSNRLFGRYVRIESYHPRNKQRRVSTLVLTPDDPDEFVRAVARAQAHRRQAMRAA